MMPDLITTTRGADFPFEAELQRVNGNVPKNIGAENGNATLPQQNDPKSAQLVALQMAHTERQDRLHHMPKGFQLPKSIRRNGLPGNKKAARRPGQGHVEDDSKGRPIIPEEREYEIERLSNLLGGYESESPKGNSPLSEKQLDGKEERLRERTSRKYLASLAPQEGNGRLSQSFLDAERQAMRTLFPDPQEPLKQLKAQYPGLVEKILPSQKRTPANEQVLAEGIQKVARGYLDWVVPIVTGTPNPNALEEFLNVLSPVAQEYKNQLGELARQRGADTAFSPSELQAFQRAWSVFTQKKGLNSVPSPFPQFDQKDPTPQKGIPPVPSPSPQSQYFDGVDARAIMLQVRQADLNDNVLTVQSRGVDLTIQQEEAANAEAVQQNNDAIDKQEQQKNANCVQKLVRIIVDAVDIVVGCLVDPALVVSGATDLFVMAACFILDHIPMDSKVREKIELALNVVNALVQIALLVFTFSKFFVKSAGEGALKTLKNVSAKVQWGTTVTQTVSDMAQTGVNVYSSTVTYEAEKARALCEKIDAAVDFCQQLLAGEVTRFKQFLNLIQIEMERARESIKTVTDTGLEITRFV